MIVKEKPDFYHPLPRHTAQLKRNKKLLQILWIPSVFKAVGSLAINLLFF
jgi:hypothetical protein